MHYTTISTLRRSGEDFIRFRLSLSTSPFLTVLSIRPYDVRIWQAQGMCYEEMGRYVLLSRRNSFPRIMSADGLLFTHGVLSYYLMAGLAVSF